MAKATSLISSLLEVAKTGVFAASTSNYNAYIMVLSNLAFVSHSFSTI